MQHEHDCDKCIFLGEYKEYDLYFHPGRYWTLVARFGKDGDYQSSPEISQINCLKEARKRAVEKGFITADQTK